MLKQGFKKQAEIIDMQSHIDKRNRKNGHFSSAERMALTRIDLYGRSIKIMKEMEFLAPDARKPMEGQRARFYLSAQPQTPMFEVVKRKGGGFTLREGHFKASRHFRDINLVARYIKGAINNRKAVLNAQIYGGSKQRHRLSL